MMDRQRIMPPVGMPDRSTGKASFKPLSAASLDMHEQHGLEIPRHVRWNKWQAEGEFIKTVRFKNVSTQVLRVSYHLLPSGSVFSVDFPETYKLSPGMVATIKVYFRPVKRQSYTDCLELLCGTASIAIPLEAVLPASKLQLPASIDFGCVPAKEPVQQLLPIKNVGDAPLRFSWRIEAPFEVVPAVGQLQPGQTVNCEVTFYPQEAAAYRVAAACSLDNGELLTVQINGMAKFPFLSVETNCLDFGNVVVGQTAEGSVRFGNHSLVPAHFSLVPVGGSNDGVFSIQPTQGTLQPNSYSVFRIVYTPKATGTFSCETFSLSTAGGNKLSLICQGTATGPQLRLSSRFFNFGNVKSGQTPSKVLYLENCSDVPLTFDFLVEANGVFSLTKTKGTLPPRSMTHTAVCFKATSPSNYWQRIVCLVKDSDPVAIDAFATCYDDTLRPPPLTYSHIAAHLDHIAATGQAFLQASTTGSRLGSSTALDESTSVQQQQQQQQERQPRSLLQSTSNGRGSTSSTFLQAAGQSHLQQQQQFVGPDSWQALFDGIAASAAISVSELELDFGSCSRLKPCEARSFTVTNNTHAKLLVSIVAPPWQDPLGPPNAGAQVYQAFPDTVELRPNSSATIRVAFRPSKDAQYYVQRLMLLAILKSQRSFRLVGEGQPVTPPWCISMLVSGNTFANCNPEFSPKVHLSSPAISFPPCRVGDAVHQTLALHNSGDTPVHFKFTTTGGSKCSGDGSGNALVVGGCSWFGPFAVLPSQGVLEAKSQQLVALRFKPKDLNPAQLKLMCVFNCTSINSTTLLLTGSTSEPQLTWDVSDGQLFFRPTCVGASSQRQITVTNTSRVPVGWQWLLSKKLQEAVTIDPWGGILRGFESTKVTINFAPVTQQVYNARAALLLLPPRAVETAAANSAASAMHTVANATAAPAVLSVSADGVEVQQEAQELDQESETVVPVQLDASSAEKLILTIVGEATQGALSVEPSSVSFGVVNVGHAQRRTLNLINQSNGILRYSVQLVDEAPEGVDRRAAACEFGTVTAALLAQSNGCENSSAGLEDCWVDEPEGVVNARASKSITLTLLPRRRGQYKLSLNLRANTVPQLSKATGIRSVSASSSSVVPASCTGGLVAVAATTAIYAVEAADSCVAHGERNSSSDNAAGSADVSITDVEGSLPVLRHSNVGRDVATSASCSWETKPPLAIVSITATASFPSLLVTDVFCQGLPKQVAWQMLGIPDINAELRSSVTEAELNAQALSDKGRLTNDNAAALLPPFMFDMGLAAAGQGPKTFWVGFTNEGQLPVEWELHSYDTPEVELENWVEPARPLTQAEKERAFIINNNIFELRPRSGSLQPGATEQVCFTFNPITEGSYQLPLFLRVKDGKKLQLQLNGKAVSPCAQLPLLVRGSQSCVFAAAPLGELEPPLQCYTLRNGGPAPMQYSLDIAPLQQLAEDNYGAEVIKYAGGSPLAGEIPPGDVAVFNWLFQPLEAKAYSVALPVMLGPAPPVPLLVRGRGYHPNKEPEQSAPTEEEAAQRWHDWVGYHAGSVINPPGRVLRCSQEMLDMGICLPASTTRRLLVLQNTAEVALQFVWDVGVYEEDRRIISGRLDVIPAQGVLEPGESRVCQVKFQSGLAPQIFSGEIFCYARCQDSESESAARRSAGSCSPAGIPSVSLGFDQSAGEVEQLERCNGEQVEEIIAQHPERPAMRHTRLQQKVRSRLPLHLSMTEAVRRKFDLLDQQYTRTLQHQQQQALHSSSTGGSRSASPMARSMSPITRSMSPSCMGVTQGASSSRAGLLPIECDLVAVSLQLLTVTVQGRVLSKEHIKGSRYIPPAEQADAHKLLAVSRLLPLVEQPVSLLLPPGSMGTSAAAAAAATASDAGDSSSAQAAPTAPAAVAKAVLQDMLAEVWADGEIAAAFKHLQEAPVPVFAQMQQALQVSGQGTAALYTHAGAPTQHAASSAAEGEEGTRMEEVLNQPEFQAFADYVLDNALVGILQEGVLEQAASLVNNH